MPAQPKSYIRDIMPATHGGISITASSAHYPRHEILDFSTCCNPYGPPANVFAAIREADIQQYPDSDSSSFIQALSEKSGVSTDNLIAGNGSTELIRLAATAYFGERDTVIIPSPTYGEYELASRIMNAHVENFVMREQDDLRLDCNSFVAFARERMPAGIFLCNPNNPTGQCLDFDELERIIKSFPNTLIILDEAYAAFTDTGRDSHKLLRANNLLILRSMTKDFSLAGLRLGYGMAAKEIIDILKKVRPPWNVNSAAQLAGIAALSNTDYLDRCMKKILSSRDYLMDKLTGLGYKLIPTHSNFFLVRVGDARKFSARLVSKGFLVRDCTSFGLPEYIRLAPRNRRECARLIKAISELGDTSNDS